jgi:hypothetical protein
MKPVTILSNLWLLRWQVLLHIASCWWSSRRRRKMTIWKSRPVKA